jgi:hypothetical protein
MSDEMAPKPDLKAVPKGDPADIFNDNEAGTEASSVSKVKRGVSHSDVTKLRYIF